MDRGTSFDISSQIVERDVAEVERAWPAPDDGPFAGSPLAPGQAARRRGRRRLPRAEGGRTY